MKQSTAKRLGNKIRMLREVHNYTQDYIADVIEVSHNTYSQMEKGVGQFTIERIEKIAGFYKMDVADLLNMNDQNIMQHFTNSNGICSSENFTINNGLLAEEKQLYKDTIKRLEDQNQRLEEQNIKLMNLIDKLSEKIS
ncbi:helix-turn-helix transcriptional regulator [Edaphocola aurantiacus]|uniref:helix-turn-helix transcriptional regulator n=1 Tax=Edaphocola aurantiacus TaxID=2601682 RepID=UPI001C9485F4|nr:helix-turn-helix transcriptional regulator [Edaphocola aurantiacus]